MTKSVSDVGECFTMVTFTINILGLICCLMKERVRTFNECVDDEAKSSIHPISMHWHVFFERFDRLNAMRKLKHELISQTNFLEISDRGIKVVELLSHVDQSSGFFLDLVVQLLEVL